MDLRSAAFEIQRWLEAQPSQSHVVPLHGQFSAQSLSADNCEVPELVNDTSVVQSGSTEHQRARWDPSEARATL